MSEAHESRKVKKRSRSSSPKREKLVKRSRSRSRSSSSGSSSSSASPSPPRKEKHKKRSRSPSPSSSDSESDSSPKKKHKKKDKKKDKSKKEKKKRKKEKKSKKKKKKDKKEEQAPTAGLMQQYGRYGIIKEIDIHAKQAEFHAWINEVKNQSSENLGKRDERELFKEFMEDYNTATFPSMKYYNLEKWYYDQARQGLLKKDTSLEGKSDEEKLRIQRLEQQKLAKQQAESAALNKVYQQLKANPEQLASLKKAELDEKINKPTFESIAKAREEKKRETEIAMRKKMLGQI